MVKGFKKSAIYATYNHRESNDLEDNFPALVIVNHHLQANTWKEKNKPIDKQDYELAAKDNILILRVEDLVLLWDAYRKEQIDKQTILNYIIQNRGWMKVDQNLKISFKPKVV